MAKRVVVTGMGVVSPVGNDVETYWRALCEGRSGVRRIDRFDIAGYPSQIAGMAEDVAPEGMSNKEIRRLDRYSLFGIEAADQAWRQAGMDMDREDPFRCGVFLGTGIGGIKTIQDEVIKLEQSGPRRVSPMMIPKGLVNMASGNVAMRYGLMGPNKCIVTACATATHSLGDALDTIRLGRADVMVAGGVEAAVIEFGLAGFGAMRALSTRNDEPERASRPYDADRDGFVIAEGAGVLILESEEHAHARGAEILGEIAGLGQTCDAHHFTAPHPEGIGAIHAMRRALDDAGINPSDIDYFNPHGTSTKYNDATESIAVRAVFGGNGPPLSSTKSMIGHLLGAAGGVEAIACLLTIRDGMIHPSINYETPDPDCQVNIVANTAREARVRTAMSNSLGFGGHNASLVLRKYE